MSDRRRSNSMYGLHYSNKDDRTTHTLVTVRPIEEKFAKDPTTDQPMTQNETHAMFKRAKVTSPIPVKSQKKKERVPSIELIEINDNEVELKIAKTDTMCEEVDDIFTEVNDDDVILLKEETEEENPRYGC